MKRLLKLAFSRMAFMALFMIIQILAVVWALTYFRENYTMFVIFFNIISVLVVIYIINEEGNPAYKITWIIPILLLPIFGVPLYVMFGRGSTTDSQRDRLEACMRIRGFNPEKTAANLAELDELDSDAMRESSYLLNSSGAPLYKNTETKFYPLGDVMYPDMLEAIKSAERFIFLEVFIIEPGEMWDPVLSVLEEKAAAGVDVRVIYDDVGCMITLPKKYNRRLEAAGIKCSVFRRFQPILSARLNNRDHRKLLIIDGHTGFTGGINFADEYINRVMRFGHWADCGVRLVGEAVSSMTEMFLRMWAYIRKTDEKFSDFCTVPELPSVESDGFVQPYCDTPLDDDAVGKTAYINMINRAKRYIWMTTPYLVLDHEMTSALISSAKCGVDVRIITPGIPDKRVVFAVTRSYYEELIRSGVKIYEYEPGFMHCKVSVSDDDTAICGTINLDYRSLYLHFEDAVWMYRCSAVSHIKKFYEETLSRCKEITMDYCRGLNWLIKLVQSLLRVFAPTM